MCKASKREVSRHPREKKRREKRSPFVSLLIEHKRGQKKSLFPSSFLPGKKEEKGCEREQMREKEEREKNRKKVGKGESVSGETDFLLLLLLVVKRCSICLNFPSFPPSRRPTYFIPGRGRIRCTTYAEYFATHSEPRYSYGATLATHRAEGETVVSEFWKSENSSCSS